MKGCPRGRGRHYAKQLSCHARNSPTVSLIFEGYDSAAIAAQSSHTLQVAIGAWDGHHRAVAVNRVAGGGEIPASAFGTLGDLGGRLPQGLGRSQRGHRQTEQQG